MSGGKFLVVDAHIAAARTERDRLKGNPCFAIVGSAASGNNQDAAVRTVLLRINALIGGTGIGYFAPFAFSEASVAIMENIEITAAPGART